jgi:hypothetical protein
VANVTATGSMGAERPSPARPRISRRGVLENAGLLVAATLLTLRAEWGILFNALTYQPDAQIHTFWMRRFQDPGLFTDPLTTALIKAGYVPLGLQTLYRIASYAIDPVTLGPWLAVVLAPLSGWLVFLIVREHTDWWPAAWMGAALFMLPVGSLRFSGGHARAFGQPVVLLTVYLLLRRRYWTAAAVPAVGGLFYPPGAVSALAITAASCLTLRGRRPSLERARTLPALACVAGTGIGLLLPRLIGSEQALITRGQAQALPDFGPRGQMHFFGTSALATLKGAYSGLDIGPSLAILLFTPVVLLLLRPRNILLLRRELLWMLVTSVLLYALALAALFRLYLPNRYTYPLLPFSCVAIAVAWRPTFESLGHRLRPALAWVLIPLGVAISLAAAYLAVRVVPLGPTLTGARLRVELDHGTRPVMAVASVVAVVAGALVWKRGAAAFRVVGVAAILAGTLLLAEVAIAGRGVSLAGHCSLGRPVLQYLGTLPKDAIIAGDPTTIGCVTLVSERPVVISRKLYQVFSAKYLSVARSRMFAMVDAYFGESRSKILALRQRYGADYLVVQPRSLAGHTAAPAWRRMAPFTGIVRRLLRSTDARAALQLPARCRTFDDGRNEVYDLRCVAGD